MFPSDCDGCVKCAKQKSAISTYQCADVRFVMQSVRSSDSSIVMLLSVQRADYVVEPIKSRDVVPKAILGAICIYFLPKLLHDVTFG